MADRHRLFLFFYFVSALGPCRSDRGQAKNVRITGDVVHEFEIKSVHYFHFNFGRFFVFFSIFKKIETENT